MNICPYRGRIFHNIYSTEDCGGTSVPPQSLSFPYIPPDFRQSERISSTGQWSDPSTELWIDAPPMRSFSFSDTRK